MINRGDPPRLTTDEDSTLAALSEEITRRLERGETVDASEYSQAYPGLAAPIRGLIPMLHTLVHLGRATDPFGGPHVHVAEDEECL